MLGQLTRERARFQQLLVSRYFSFPFCEHLQKGFSFCFCFVLTVFVRLFVFFLFTFCFVVFVFWGTPSHLRNLDFLPRQAFFFWYR